MKYLAIIIVFCSSLISGFFIGNKTGHDLGYKDGYISGEEIEDLYHYNKFNSDCKAHDVVTTEPVTFNCHGGNLNNLDLVIFADAEYRGPGIGVNGSHVAIQGCTITSVYQKTFEEIAETRN